MAQAKVNTAPQEYKGKKETVLVNGEQSTPENQVVKAGTQHQNTPVIKDIKKISFENVKQLQDHIENDDVHMAGNIVDGDGKNKYEFRMHVHPLLVENTREFSFSVSILGNRPEPFENFREVVEYCQTLGITQLVATGGGVFNGVLIDSLSSIVIPPANEYELTFYGYNDTATVDIRELEVDHFRDGTSQDKAVVLGVNGIGGSNPTLTRTDSSTSFSYRFDDNLRVVSDFDNVYPYKAMAIVTDNLGNKFVRIPKFYSKKEYDETTGTYKLRISNIKLPKYDTLFKILTADDKLVEIPYIDVGVYEASLSSDNKLQSQSGKTILVNKTMENFRTYARANGNEYGIEDYITREIINELFMIEFATTNSQSIFVGVTNGSNTAGIGTTGATDSLGTNNVVSGKLSLSSSLRDDGSFKYRGMENLWGDYWEFVDGISFNEADVYLSIQPSDFASAKITDSYKKVGTRATTNGWAKKMAHFTDEDSEYKEMLKLMGYTTEVGGNDSTYYCDYYYYASGGTILIVGGRWDYGSRAGAFDLNGGSGASNVSALVGSRLVRRPIE